MKMSIADLHQRYRQGTLTPRALVEELRLRIEAHADYHAWITVLDNRALQPVLDRLDGHSPDTLPLFGIPFAIKDNIHLAGVATTAACEGFSHVPDYTATLVARLIEAGAIPLGKTNMDQFATGLVGTRSPYGVTLNSFDSRYISGGSSSGSAVAVALGEVTFALGTDTAGSGRVPAAFNNVIGIKPTRGRWSCHGVVPACRTLDCPSLFVLDPQDGALISSLLQGYDAADPYSRSGEPHGFDVRQPRIGVPDQASLQFFGDADYASLFEESLARWRSLGAEITEIDFSPFREAAAMLYQGPWVTERWLVAESCLRDAPDTVLPVIRDILAQAGEYRASDAYRNEYRRAQLQRRAAEILASVDVLLTPTAGRHFTIAEVMAEPIARNTDLGYYTNFMNLLDLCAVAVPAAMTRDGRPFGITLVAPAFHDEALLALGQRWLQALDLPLGAGGHRLRDDAPAVSRSGRVELVVCGAHLSGMPLNHQLTSRGGWCVEATHSAPCYRLYALAGGPLPRPAMVRDDTGAAIEVEVWSLPESQLGSFVAAIPAPLGIGKVKLADGREYPGFICEHGGVAGAEDITSFGGWRAWIARRNSA